MLLYSNTDMKAQSVLYNFIIMQNWEKERTSIQLNFLKLNPSVTTCFGKSSHMDSPSLKMKKTLTSLKIFFENQKCPLPPLVQAGRTLWTHIHTHTHTHTHIYIYTNTHIYVNTHIHVCVYIYIYIYTYYIHIHIYTHKHVYIYIYTYPCLYIMYI